MKVRLAVLMAAVGASAVALSATAQGSNKLSVDDELGYYCPDGRQIYVFRCYDGSPQASCQYVAAHKPMTNNFQFEAINTRAELLTSLADCTLTPVTFDNRGVVTLKKPAQMAQAKPAAPATTTVTDGWAIGVKNVRSSLVRITPPGSVPYVFYVDEASRRPTGEKDVVAIWMLQVWPGGNPSVPSVSAVWTELNANCKQKTYELTLAFMLDRQANVLGSEAMTTRGTSTKDVTVGNPSNIACKTATPASEQRFASASAAIADALATAAPKSAAAPTTPAAKPDAEAQARLAFLEGERLSADYDDHDAALAAFAKAVKLDPKLRSAWLRQAQIYVGRGDVAAAIPMFEKAVALDPTVVDTQDAFCTALYADQNTKKGIPVCERLLAMKPPLIGFSYARLSYLYALKGDHQKALATRLERAQLQPKEADAWTDVADSYVALHKNTEALAAVQKAVALEPKNDYVLGQRGGIFLLLKRTPEAVADFQAAIKLEADQPQYHGWLADALRASGKTAEADAEKKIAITRLTANIREMIKQEGWGRALYDVDMLAKWDAPAAAKLRAEIEKAKQ